jgi:recombination protein RecA
MERDKALDMALSQIEKQFGKGSIMRMGEHAGVGVEAISTGAMALDLALGIGGLPRGRVVEIFGPESSGKSTLALHVVAEAQRNGGICAYIDAEHALDPVYAKAIGVDIDEMLISQPDTGEQGLEIADMLIRSGAIDVVVIDSVAALTPRAHVSGAAKADRDLVEVEHDRRVHQPVAGEDRDLVRITGSDPRWACAQVLLIDPPRDPPGGDDQGRCRDDR